MPKIGIIGGTGLYDPTTLEDVRKLKVHTPYGAPSDALTTGRIEGAEVVMLPRHGSGHVLNPSQINYRANIWAMRELGVTHILSPTAVGSLQERIKPGDIIFPDQFIDRTAGRKSTFYDGPQVCHVSMAYPFCPSLRRILGKTAKELRIRHHSKGTCVVVEGPRFSTRAESQLYRKWGADLINMTMVPECVLAREAQICYASIATVTDWDCWKEHAVTAEMVATTMKENLEKVKGVIRHVIPKVSDDDCSCKHALDGAFL